MLDIFAVASCGLLATTPFETFADGWLSDAVAIDVAPVFASQLTIAAELLSVAPAAEEREMEALADWDSTLVGEELRMVYEISESREFEVKPQRAGVVARETRTIRIPK